MKQHLKKKCLLFKHSYPLTFCCCREDYSYCSSLIPGQCNDILLVAVTFLVLFLNYLPSVKVSASLGDRRYDYERFSMVILLPLKWYIFSGYRQSVEKAWFSDDGLLLISSCYFVLLLLVDFLLTVTSVIVEKKNSWLNFRNRYFSNFTRFEVCRIQKSYY